MLDGKEKQEREEKKIKKKQRGTSLDQNVN